MRGNSRILELLHLILTSRSYGARVVRTAVTMVAHNSPHPSLVPAVAGLVSNFKLLTGQQKFCVSCGTSGSPGGQPDGEGDDDAETGNPYEQAFGYRAKGSQVGSAGGPGGLDLLQEGDDVLLAFGSDVGVVEHRHVLRARDH